MSGVHDFVNFTVFGQEGNINLLPSLKISFLLLLFVFSFAVFSSQSRTRQFHWLQADLYYGALLGLLLPRRK